MKISEAWLREWVNPDVDVATIADQLTRAGLEVDELKPAAPAFSGVVVGRVVAVEAHPDADKLRVCRVDIGSDEPQQVVCGAANVEPNICVPYAVPGAILPSGATIENATLRGVASAGMLCSAKELGLSDQAAGLMALPADAEAGADLREYLGVDGDHVIELELTPNRGDCLSIEGVAREIATINRLPYLPPSIVTSPPDLDEILKVSVDDEEDCPRYAGRVIRGLRPDATTPLWMQERLRRCGLRSIHPVVDVTNYVMLELGQPMHAFDLDKLKGSLSVRKAVTEESIQLLDGQEVALDGETMVIADESGPVAIAGVMGGDRTAVDRSSSNIFFESACFAPLAVAGTGRKYKLHTDSLHRFERGVDSELQVRALERATMLLMKIGGGQAGPMVQVEARLRRPRVIHLRQSYLDRLLGVEVEASDVQDILKRLGLSVAHEGSGLWKVTIPSYRYDLSIEADLVEEIARIFGYDNLPSRPQAVSVELGHAPEAIVPASRLADCLVERGYQEVVTYSFVDAALQNVINPSTASVAVDNPIAEQFAVMRSTLWSSLLPVWKKQLQHRHERARLFELGVKFSLQDNVIIEEKVVSGIVSGPRFAEQWGAESSAVDFFDVKADVEAFLAFGGQSRLVQFSAEPHTALHPGQSAVLMAEGRPVGWVGKMHPSVATQLDLPVTPFLFEVDADFAMAVNVPRFRSYSEYPSIRRDLALNVPVACQSAELVRCLNSAEEPLLSDITVFDVYQGQGLADGFKSIALGLIFQDNSRTLIDDEVEKITQRLIERLSRNLGVTIRG